MKLNAWLAIPIIAVALVAVLASACGTLKPAGPAAAAANSSATSSTFRVDSLTVNPAQVNAGVDALITAKVTNTGLTNLKYEGQVRIDNVSEPSLPTFLACQLVNVAPGSTQVVSVPATINNPGNYQVTLDGITQSFVVNPADPNALNNLLNSGTAVPAIDFTATDVVTGKTISLRDYRGKAILLNFVNYGCNPSVNDVVSAQLLSIKKLTDQRSDFIPVSVFCGCCPPDVLKKFAKDNNLNWPWILDTDNSIVAKYGKYVQQFGYPTLVYISPEFSITGVTGAVSQPALNDKLNSLVLAA